MIATLLAAVMLIQQPDSTEVLNAASIYGESQRRELMHLSLNSIDIGRNYIENNFSGTLMQSLSAIPGVQARAIGSGQSKPAIRGLGFNRIVVAVNRIKHEGQQWGDDHGLEIDQFAVDRVEVIKGPGALMYGSDAIGGVLGIYTNYLPTAPFEGRVNLFARSIFDGVDWFHFTGITPALGGDMPAACLDACRAARAISTGGSTSPARTTPTTASRRTRSNTTPTASR